MACPLAVHFVRKILLWCIVLRFNLYYACKVVDRYPSEIHLRMRGDVFVINPHDWREKLILLMNVTESMVSETQQRPFLYDLA